ncbi:MAG: tRNA (adenosine(37)-N6)-threonylcarbamoyltransferase complex ATPase subunit type 1 TsaE [Chromatiaceae bacterium]|nr:tRNA (adenosine(37)-N6)-threonylcarbamoyltransferase complex ATPase subunit type 1 TsaE [Chromatiaceae bacterium]
MVDNAAPVLTFEPESQEQQELLGAVLADFIPAASIVYLTGDLGAGKTTLVRGYLRGLGYTGTVKSPTYTLIEPYMIGEHSVSHLDLYRVADAEELEYLGLRDLLQEESVLFIEWPERGEGVLPGADLTIAISYREPGRTVRITPGSKRGSAVVARLEAAAVVLLPD